MPDRKRVKRTTIKAVQAGEKMECGNIDPYYVVIYGKALKYVSFVLNKFSPIANIELRLNTYWHKRGEQLRHE